MTAGGFVVLESRSARLGMVPACRNCHATGEQSFVPAPKAWSISDN
jgi:hypothetical protein